MNSLKQAATSSTTYERWKQFRISIDAELPNAKEPDDGFTTARWEGARPTFEGYHKRGGVQYARKRHVERLGGDNQRRDGEITFKEWRTAEALRLGLSPAAIFEHYQNGLYPNLKLRKVNQRVIFVRI